MATWRRDSHPVAFTAAVIARESFDITAFLIKSLFSSRENTPTRPAYPLCLHASQPVGSRREISSTSCGPIRQWLRHHNLPSLAPDVCNTGWRKHTKHPSRIQTHCRAAISFSHFFLSLKAIEYVRFRLFLSFLFFCARWLWYSVSLGSNKSVTSKPTALTPTLFVPIWFNPLQPLLNAVGLLFVILFE
jgi:hypothetical protein